MLQVQLLITIKKQFLSNYLAAEQTMDYLQYKGFDTKPYKNRLDKLVDNKYRFSDLCKDADEYYIKNLR